MKKILLAIVIAFSLFVTPAMASETCDLSDGTDCEIWWMYDKTDHWRACVNHRNQNGEDTPVSEKEPHTFEEGICTVCEVKETKGTGGSSYIFVFIVVVAIGYLTTFKSSRAFKKNKFDERPFGLDKFRKF